MQRRFPYRVRVIRQSEAWVDVEAPSKEGAFHEAAKVPGVISVFLGSAIRADEQPESERMPGVVD